ncbi:hypothetical protein SAMN05421890_0683 [Ensifer adhaerens]|nr:hypothetical protein SAMN05421890_0683 [Ensifer adhaerens]HZG29677.1 hypothetical protein [Ensifer sp.]
MVKDREIPPVSGSDDSRAGDGKAAARQREDAFRQAERGLQQQPGAGNEDGVETPSHELAMAYLKLGGRRRAVMDDNVTDTRKWEPDLPEAEQFWQTHIASLPEAERRQVEQHLPSINVE